jgi:hypothetical protein
VADNIKSSKKLITDYLKKRVTAELDGSLFDHEPATFRFRFLDPKKLGEELSENYQDELGALDVLDEDGNWSSDTLVPVAAVSSISVDDEDEEDDEPYEFAWIFLDWSTKSPPGVLVMTTDDWGRDRTVKDLAALKLKVG